MFTLVGWWEARSAALIKHCPTSVSCPLPCRCFFFKSMARVDTTASMCCAVTHQSVTAHRCWPKATRQPKGQSLGPSAEVQWQEGSLSSPRKRSRLAEVMRSALFSRWQFAGRADLLLRQLLQHTRGVGAKDFLSGRLLRSHSSAVWSSAWKSASWKWFRSGPSDTD